MTNSRCNPPSNNLQSPLWKNRLASWGVYAAAAGAALATASNADANIIYSGLVDLTLSVPPGVSGVHRSSQTLHIEGVRESFGVAEYFQPNPVNPDLGYRLASARLGSGALYFMLNFGGVSFRKYSPNEPILIDHPASFRGRLRSNFSDAFGHNSRGQFGPGTVEGFVAFNLPSGSENSTRGWIQVKVSDRNHDGYPDELEVIDWAYNDVPNGPINAGQTSSATTPEPGSMVLALLGAGAMGLSAWRRRKTRRVDVET